MPSKKLEKLEHETLSLRGNRATWQSPGFSGLHVKRTNALTNRPELLGDCHDQCAHWSRNDRIFLNTNLSFLRRCCPGMEIGSPKRGADNFL